MEMEFNKTSLDTLCGAVGKRRTKSLCLTPTPLQNGYIGNILI